MYSTGNCCKMYKMLGFILQFLAKREHCPTEAVEKIMQTYFAEDYAKRKKSHEEEMSEVTRYVVPPAW